MKKTFLLCISCILIAVLCATIFVACGKKQNDNSSNSGYTLNFNTVYALAEEAGYTGTLEDLIELFKGDNAYQLAVATGYTGTEEDWLNSLVGATGKDGKDGLTPTIGANGNWFVGDTDTGVRAEAKDGENGIGIVGIVKTGTSGLVDTYTITFTGGNSTTFTVTNGKDGENGQNGNNGTDGNGIVSILKTGTEGLMDTYTITFTDGKTTTFTITNGKDGANGKDGQDGKSAYELAKENGYTGTVTEWLASLVGATGAAGAAGANGQNGTNGKSAYELAVDNGYTGTVQEWLASLVGAPGTNDTDGSNGQDGKSAYEIAKDHGYTGTEEEWIASLVGAKGDTGEQGPQGPQGEPGKDAEVSISADGYWVINDTKTNVKAQGEQGIQGETGAQGPQGEQGIQGPKGDTGAQGIGVTNAYIDASTHLILVLSDGTEIDAGYVGIDISTNTKTYIVVFKDYDGTVLKEETVEDGGFAIAPTNPSRVGYLFVGWDETYSNVKENLTVTALYQEITNPTFVVENVIATLGQTDIVVTISLKNNPGISSIALDLTFDEGISLTNCIYNQAVIGGTYADYNASISSPRLVWVNWAVNIEGDFVFATLHFDASNATQGTYSISIQYNPDDVYDVNENNVSFDIINGCIIVE